MAKRKRPRVDISRISVMQKCYAAKSNILPGDLSRERDIGGGLCVIDGQWVNRSVRRKVKALERGGRKDGGC